MCVKDRFQEFWPVFSLYHTIIDLSGFASEMFICLEFVVFYNISMMSTLAQYNFRCPHEWTSSDLESKYLNYKILFYASKPLRHFTLIASC